MAGLLRIIAVVIPALSQLYTAQATMIALHPPSGYSLNRTKHGSGFLDIYEADPAIYSNDTHPIRRSSQAECGENTPIECSRENLARLDLCLGLADWMARNYDYRISPWKSLCWWTPEIGKEVKCCATWSNPMKDGVAGYAIKGILDIEQRCKLDGEYGISGMVHNVRMGSVCATQCLSNRWRGCMGFD